MNRSASDFLTDYQNQSQERAALNIPPRPLDARQVALLVEFLKDPALTQPELFIDLLTQRVPPGVDQAAYVKAAFLTDVATRKVISPWLSPQHAVELLGTMLGGYNVPSLIALLDDAALGEIAAKQLAHTLLLFDAYHDVMEKVQAGNHFAQSVLQSWASAAWFTTTQPVPECMVAVVFKLSGEINTDDLSPATEAWSRSDIPFHSLSMLRNRLSGALDQIQQLKQQGSVAFVGDVVGTGSSRKSAINSVQWHLGHLIPFVPNKNQGGIILGGKIAPIFKATAEDSGALPIEVDVNAFNTGDIICVYPFKGIITNAQKQVLARFQPDLALLDAFRVGGRIRLIIGRSLTNKVRAALKLPDCEIFYRPRTQTNHRSGFTLAQKMVGRACGVDGILPGVYCEPKISTVGSQDTTGPMTRDELKELACLGFSADFVLQTFCHTAAYPKPIDIETQHNLPDFFAKRGGVVLRPGDGIIHSWLNRMLLPDQVGTGGDSHTRFPIGISFPAGSGMVAFAAAMGIMPLVMPESVRVRFTGTIQPGITLRDLVHAIPYVALQQGLLTCSGAPKKNIFSGRILEIEGLPDLKVEQAFEFADASAERSAYGCTVRLNPEPIIEYLRSNLTLLKWMIHQGYQDTRSLQRRIAAMEAWLNDPQLLTPDQDADYVATLEIDLNQITEPLLACPNDPDYVRPLSEIAETKIDEVFIGSCMTNIGHYRAAGALLKKTGRVPTNLWIVPPTKMDAQQLMNEGYYAIYGACGARTETPGCSLCMGNQARVRDGATVISTSTRNFPNRMGKDANVYLASAELSAITATLGYIPNLQEYQKRMHLINPLASELYRYLNFDQLEEYLT